MKTPVRITQDNHHALGRFSQALSADSEIPRALTSSVRLLSFRVPWAPLRTTTRETDSQLTLGAVLAKPEALPQSLATSTAVPFIAKLDLVPETERRLEIRISVRGETRRPESSEHRFWGINE